MNKIIHVAYLPKEAFIEELAIYVAKHLGCLCIHATLAQPTQRIYEEKFDNDLYRNHMDIPINNDAGIVLARLKEYRQDVISFVFGVLGPYKSLTSGTICRYPETDKEHRFELNQNLIDWIKELT